jgi:hypothetical protein
MRPAWVRHTCLDGMPLEVSMATCVVRDVHGLLLLSEVLLGDEVLDLVVRHTYAAAM